MKKTNEVIFDTFKPEDIEALTEDYRAANNWRNTNVDENLFYDFYLKGAELYKSCRILLQI